MQIHPYLSKHYVTLTPTIPLQLTDFHKKKHWNQKTEIFRRVQLTGIIMNHNTPQGEQRKI